MLDEAANAGRSHSAADLKNAESKKCKQRRICLVYFLDRNRIQINLTFWDLSIHHRLPPFRISDLILDGLDSLSGFEPMTMTHW